MKCPCRGCTDRTLTCKAAGQCKPWEKWKAEQLATKEWLRQQRPITSEQMRKRANDNIKRRARGWHRSRGGDNE